jgi:hypothetical protein
MPRRGVSVPPAVWCYSRLDDGLRSNDFFERQRHVDEADTTLAGHIPDEDLASVRPDGLPSD